MTDKNSNTFFDDKVKEALQNYDAGNNSNWSRMEDMLNASPQSSSINSINKKVLVKALVAVAIVVGGYMIYTLIPNDTTVSKQQNETVVSQQEENNPDENPTQEEQKNNLPGTEITKHDKKEEATTNNVNIEPEQPKEQTVKITADIVAEKEVKIKDKKEKKTPEGELKKSDIQKVITMGNEPVFGDMLDSSKGIVGKTKEKEEIKKAAKEQANTSTSGGWNTFLFSPVAPDSIRKNREKQQADSLKKK